MPSKPNANKKIYSYICAILMLILLVLQFMPFWHYGEQGELSTSISSYIWFPADHADLTKYLTASVRDDYAIEQILVMPILTLVLSACGVVFCVIKSTHPTVWLFPAACGLIGIWGYLTEPVFRLGANWGVHLALCVVMLLAAAYAFYKEYLKKA